ncbi:hypothetical protein DPEC_G00077510 [Dallia pectoralis]|uniref:Uncharacterized protein n=1 Tax=Dallia pectoralis TaxID=75939 RepID=A0ACC2H416_DALPE|nr:hypothetical protein DPEC_G00077510 [Dallia pectoralis]
MKQKQYVGLGAKKLWENQEEPNTWITTKVVRRSIFRSLSTMNQTAGVTQTYRRCSRAGKIGSDIISGVFTPPQLS